MRDVRIFYNKDGWKSKNHQTLDSVLFEDTRKCASDYVSNCRKRILKYIPKKGKKILDFASGPIQYKEYLKYSKNFKYRYCVDFSYTAIKEAKKKLGKNGKYFCGDFFKLKFKKNYFDCALSMHTIYHIDKNKQKLAVKKLLSLVKKNKPVIIVYSNPLTLISRMKPYFLKNKRKKILYFYCHPNSWWNQFSKVADVKIYPWRSFSSQHQKRIFPNNYLGKLMLKILFKLEFFFPNFFANNFQYITIILKKK